MAVHGCAVRSPLTGCQVTWRPRDRFSRYSKWPDTFRTALVCVYIYIIFLRAVSEKQLDMNFVFLTVHPCIIFFQMKPARCTLLLSVFISISLHVSANYVPIIRRTYCIYKTLAFFTLYGWQSGLLLPTSRQEVSSVYLVGFIWKRLYRDIRSAKHKICGMNFYPGPGSLTRPTVDQDVPQAIKKTLA